MDKKQLQIRWHGRGGQGAKTAAGMVAEVAVTGGKHAQGAPEYGAEREGAPIKAYTRISGEPIRVHDAIYYPDVVMVLDDSLLETEDVTDGLAEDGILLVNTKSAPSEIRERMGLEGRTVCTIDATGIALEEIGRPIPNTVMIGALLQVTGAVQLDAIEKAIHKKFGKKLSAGMLEGNIRAVERAAKEVQTENG
jgi:pyruvate ferredoxin oxidoreductase gamma subunit